MNLEKLKPWNWFKHEEPERVYGGSQIPVTKTELERPDVHSGTSALQQLHKDMDRLFDQVFSGFGLPGLRTGQYLSGLGGAPGSLLSQVMPQIDICGDEKQYDISLDVPGFKQDDIAIELDGEVLRIRGEVEQKSETKDKHYYRAERRVGSFQRTLALPEDANAEDITATLNDGVLHLSMPRRASPERDVKKISISC
ncbi:MAG: heat-shock protein Hsp20 [Oleiphilus sp.]|nr:MAG: heat-shock protein Hsp20 [Oleiphilus sp.]